MSRWLCALAGLGLLLQVASPVLAAGLVVGTAPGFGRLAIDWDEPVTLSSRSVGDAVEIEASRPFPSRLEAAGAELGALVEALTLDDDGRVLRLRPVEGVTVETALLDGQLLRIGLIAPGAPVLGLRLGQHEQFRRLVIEPVVRGSVLLARMAGRIDLVLPGRLAAADLDRLRGMPGVTGVWAAGDQLILSVAQGATVRDLFVSPDKQVVDISVGGAREAGFAALPGTAAIGPTVPPATSALPRPRPSAPLRPSSSRDESASRQALTEPEHERQAVVEPRTSSVTPALEAVRVEAARAADGAVELGFAWPEPVPAAVFLRGTRLWVVLAAAGRAIDIDSPAFARAAQPLVKTLRQVPHPTATLLHLDLHEAAVTAIEREGGQWRVRLGSTAVAPTPFATAPLLVETAGPALRLPDVETVVSVTDPLVGDRLEIGLSSTVTGPLSAGRRFVGLRLLPTLQGAAWRRLDGSDRLPELAADGLMLGPHDGILRLPVDDPHAEEMRSAARPAEEERRPLDPLAAPVQPQSTGVGSAGTDDVPAMLERTPASASTTPFADGAIGDGAGDDEPPDDQRVQPMTTRTAPPSASSPLGLARFADVHGQRFWDRRATLMQALNHAPADERPALQLDLGRLHLANGLGTEAASLLADTPFPDAEDAGAGDAVDAYRALDGAAALLAGRPAAALVQLAHPSLLGDEETALWRAAARAALKDWDEALADWRRGSAAFDTYPPMAQAALGEHAAMLLLQTGEIDDVFALLGRLAALPLSKATRERLQLLEATALERDGAIDEARSIWRALMEAGGPEVRPQASLALVEADLAAGRIVPAEAADRLASDSVAWRGHGEELDFWRRLAALRVEAGQAEAALTILQEALARAPQTESAGIIVAEMSAILDRLFADQAAGRRSATSMLLTYRRFAELVPPGPMGDRQVGQLATSIAALGLDEAAMEILRDRLRQSDRRDQGRAVLGLALGRLLAAQGDPAGAMAALLDSNTLDPLDPSIALARRTLLTSLGQAGEGPVVGESDAAAQPLLRLRDQARQAFDRAAWPELVALAEQLEADLPPADMLERVAAEALLLVATAGRQLADDALVERLASRYADRLPVAADRSILRLLANAAAFRGAPADVLDDAKRHARRLRDAIGTNPPV